MENILDQEERERSFTDQEIFTKIWTQPRAVLQYIHHTRYDKFVVPLLIMAGIANAFDRAVSRNMGDSLSLGIIIAICLLMGGLLGWLSYYIYAALVRWTGLWLEGKGATEDILRVLAYAMIPSMIVLILLVPQIGIYGVELFKADGDIVSADITSNIIFYGTIVLEIILGIYSIVFCVIGISIVQQLSTGKSILNLILPVLLFVIPLLFFTLLIGG